MKLTTILIAAVVVGGGYYAWQRYKRPPSTAVVGTFDTTGNAIPVSTADGDSAVSDSLQLQSATGTGPAPETLQTRETVAIGGTLAGSYYALSPMTSLTRLAGK